MFESKSEKLISRRHFVERLGKSFAWSMVILFISLMIGIMGYHYFASLNWVDAILNAAMILGGMGPVDPLVSDSAKLFAAGYAIFSGVVFIGLMAMMLAPIMHRVLHRFHAEK
jgi:hypothetical protein